MPIVDLDVAGSRNEQGSILEQSVHFYTMYEDHEIEGIAF